jgi:hypothetical protein
MDYVDLDRHPHVIGLAPFVRLEDAEDHRVLRLPWHLGGVATPLRYKRPVAVTVPEWREPRSWAIS